MYLPIEIARRGFVSMCSAALFFFLLIIFFPAFWVCKLVL